MELYIIENYKERYQPLRGQELTEALIKECLEDYGVIAPGILRSPKGKPYIENPAELSKEGSLQKGEVHFSVSHSGDYFVCIISDKKVGIDIQTHRKASTDKIAKRYFTDREIQLIQEGSDDDFYFLWARKEAYSKYTGKGLEEVMSGTSVLDRDDVEFVDFQLEDGLWCSYCIEI